MSNGSSYQARFLDIHRQVPVEFGFHDAERARICADTILMEGDEEFIRWMVAQGAMKQISASHSRIRARTNRLSQKIATARSVKGQQLMLAQLTYPITPPNQPSVQLGEATFELIDAMFESETVQIEGRQRNLAMLRNFREVTRPYPGRTVLNLVQSKQITLNDLFPRREKRKTA